MMQKNVTLLTWDIMITLNWMPMWQLWMKLNTLWQIQKKPRGKDCIRVGTEMAYLAEKGVTTGCIVWWTACCVWLELHWDRSCSNTSWAFWTAKMQAKLVAMICSHHFDEDRRRRILTGMCSTRWKSLVAIASRRIDGWILDGVIFLVKIGPLYSKHGTLEQESVKNTDTPVNKLIDYSIVDQSTKEHKWSFHVLEAESELEVSLMMMKVLRQFLFFFFFILGGHWLLSSRSLWWRRWTFRLFGFRLHHCIGGLLLSSKLVQKSLGKFRWWFRCLLACITKSFPRSGGPFIGFGISLGWIFICSEASSLTAEVKFWTISVNHQSPYPFFSQLSASVFRRMLMLARLQILTECRRFCSYVAQSR